MTHKKQQNNKKFMLIKRKSKKKAKKKLLNYKVTKNWRFLSDFEQDGCKSAWASSLDFLFNQDMVAPSSCNYANDTFNPPIIIKTNQSAAQ